MHYSALLLSPEPTEELDLEAQATIVAQYQDFHTRAGSAIRSGDALTPSASRFSVTAIAMTWCSTPPVRDPGTGWPPGSCSTRAGVIGSLACFTARDPCRDRWSIASNRCPSRLRAVSRTW